MLGFLLVNDIEINQDPVRQGPLNNTIDILMFPTYYSKS